MVEKIAFISALTVGLAYALQKLMPVLKAFLHALKLHGAL